MTKEQAAAFERVHHIANAVERQAATDELARQIDDRDGIWADVGSLFDNMTARLLDRRVRARGLSWRILFAEQQQLDLHRFTACERHQVMYDDVTPEQRREAKRHNFQVLFGLAEDP